MLAVLLYHLWPNRVTGGFVGVDVFFVISGYLITSHLLRERYLTGRIAIGRFWARRAARLLPASLLVLAASALATMALVPRTLWQQFFGEHVASALYAQNWNLLLNSVDYLAADNIASPVQHFWTLSAEEQFYILLPLILLAAGTAFGKRNWRRVYLVAIFLAAAASLVYSVWLTNWSPGEAYFSTFSRAWEFGAGALLAFLPGARARWARLTSELAGIALIGVAMLAFSDATVFPGLAALLPVVGTMLAIWGGTTSLLDRVGRAAPVEFLGRVSYALYLWHWPLIVLVPYATDRPLDTLDKTVIAVIAGLLAWLSTDLFEHRVRRSPRLLFGRRPRFVFATTALAMLLVIALSTAPITYLNAEANRVDHATAELKETLPRCFGAQAMDPDLAPCDNPDLETQPLVPALSSIRDDDDNRDRDDCWSRQTDSEFRYCSLGPSGGYSRHLLAIGDSHNNTLIGAYERVALAKGWRIDVAGHEGCHLTKETLELRSSEGTAACEDWRETAIDHLSKTQDVDGIIVTRFAGHQDEDADGVRGMVEAWGARADLSVPVLALRDNPRLPGATVQCIEEDTATAVTRCAAPREEALIDDGLARAVEADPNATLIDFTDLYCDSSMCPPIIGGAVVYRDGSHLTSTFAATLSPYLAKALEQQLGAREG